MPIFRDIEHFYSVMTPFFNRLKDNPEIGPKVIASGLVIRFIYTEPDAILTIDCPNAQVIQGNSELNADVEMMMKAEVAHRFWLGKVNLMLAITKREITAKGPIPKILKLLPIIKDSYAMYREYLIEIGMPEAVEV
ncbi:MAG: SCP2 sterol-binding domain-containing protein [bacterium]